MSNLVTKTDLLNKLRLYSTTPDDDNILFKRKIKEKLLTCPELLYAIDSPELKNNLFNDDGTINYDGEWDAYFGTSSHIRGCLYVPQTQDDVRTLICYQSYSNTTPRANTVEKYARIVFNVFVHGSMLIDELTGIERHDLIASILRERFNYSNILGYKMLLIGNEESITDQNYVLRTLIFQSTNTNGILNSSNGSTRIDNFVVKK